MVEVFGLETYEVESDNAFPSLGEPNDELRHQLLNGRELNDQHPITAITGLRDELDYIESLKTVYSNEKQVADYYIWQDENVFNDDRTWRFVSLCQDISAIRLCDDGNVFGVTVDAAAFVGGQDDVVRDYHYGLVATTGVVHVQCESDVEVGDYVLSNDYGVAKKSRVNYGYKVVALHTLHDVRHAVISLNSFVDQIHSLGEDMVDVNVHLSDLDKNVAAAVNEANTANQRVEKLQDEMENFQVNIEDIVWASKDAADAATNTMNNYKQQIEDAQRISAQAENIANSAITSADRIRTEAVDVAAGAVTKANQTQKDITDLMTTMVPLLTWESGSGTGIMGLATQVKNNAKDIALLGSVEGGDGESLVAIASRLSNTESILDHITSRQGVNGSTIAQVEQKADDNGASITSLVSSVDKYSVGEYSQAYGLTRDQAASILKIGYTYIPTRHINTVSHNERFVGENEVNEFTPGCYYVWGVRDDGKADWIERVNSAVWISNSMPSTMYDTLKYWYINSDTAPDGYEPYALYMWFVPEDGEAYWKKVNTLSGNVNNRITSMIRQTTNEIAAEVTNARGNAATLSARLSETDASVQTVANWIATDGQSLATIKQTADDAGASIAQIAQNIGGYIAVDSWSLTSKDTAQIYYVSPESKYYYYKNGWKSTTDPIEAGVKINAASIVTAINDAGSSVNIKANHINLEGIVTANNYFQINTDGSMKATSGDIGGWVINSGGLEKQVGNYKVTMRGVSNDPSLGAFYITDTTKSETSSERYPFVVTYKGQMKAMSGNIGGWTIGSFTDGGGIYTGSLYKDAGQYRVFLRSDYAAETDVAFGVKKYVNANKSDTGSYTFAVSHNGNLTATAGNIGGFTINGTGLYKETTGYSITIRGNIAAGEESNKGAIYITKKSDNSYPFLVRYDGFLRATNAEISGKITATSGNFSNDVTIGGTSITAGSLRKLYNAASGQTGSDTIQIKRIEATSGSVGGWTIDSAALYSEGVGYKTFINGQGFIHTYNTSTYPLITWQQVVLAVYATGAGDGSDLRLKHGVNHIDENYDVFFDSLKPKTFYYNDNALGYDPDRLHFGFVAQDVLASQDKFGLSDLSVVSDGEYYRLQRQEFIALNTWQIQKAKKRIADLEARVEQLEKLLGEKGEN